MSDERKKLCVSVGINFLAGIIIGLMLFYAHIKSGQEMLTEELYYEKNVSISDVLRVCWLNIMWVLSVFMAHTILPVGMLHVVVGIRGSVNAFSLMYLFNMFGIKKAIVSVLPQCLSVLPMLMWFSVLCVERRRMRREEGKDTSALSCRDSLMMFIISAVAAVFEVMFFVVLSKVLL